MVRTRYAPDRGLQARMGLTLFLLGLVFVAFVIALVFILIAFKVGAGAIIFFAVILGGGLAFGSLFWSDKIALRASGAKEVSPAEAPQLHGIIDRLCALADMPKPRVAIAQADMPNAFATGRNSKNAVVCVTTGLLRRLDDKELEGVLAHEISHVAHKDVAVMTIASVVGVIAALMVRFAFYSELFGGGDRGRGGNNNSQSGLLILPIMVLSMLVYAISFLLIRMLSRYRELSADRSGALLTGRPSSLASALVKVTGDMGKIPTKDLRAAEPLNAFFFAPAVALRGQQTLATLFSTHPPLQRRLDQLQKISEQLNK